MIGNMIGAALNLKTRLVDTVIGKLPEPLRSEASGFRAEAAGRLKELTGLGMEAFSYLNRNIEAGHEIKEDNRVVSDKRTLKKIELD